MHFRYVDDLERGLHAAGNMDADVALLAEVAAGGPPAVRVYTWRRPGLSLGRFQDVGDVDRPACDRYGVEVVRRPTGGRALLHGGDLTYAVVMRRPVGPNGGVEPLYRRIAGGLIAGLARLGVVAEVAHHAGSGDAACLASQQGSDLRVGSRKVCGSAQLHRQGAVLQHGSILLTRLPFDETDVLRFPDPGSRGRAQARLVEGTVTLAELGRPSEPAVVARALRRGFADTLGITFETATGPDARNGFGARRGGVSWWGNRPAVP